MALTDQDNPNPERLWRHRRWMAWIGMGFSALAWAVGIAMSYADPSNAPGAIHPLTTAAMWGGLVPMGAYVGNCISDVRAGK